MRVRELIEQLQESNPDQEVILSTGLPEFDGDQTEHEPLVTEASSAFGVITVIAPGDPL